MSVPVLKVAARLPLFVAGLAIAGSGHAAERTTLDLTAGVGASTNPSLQVGGTGSAFGRVSALGMHEWRSERTVTSISLYGENTTYVKTYGSKQIFDLNARTTHQVNPNLTVFGSVGFSGDFGGQLSNRFATVTPDLTVPPLGQLPPTLVLSDPNWSGFGGRQYRLIGQAGLTTRASARSSVSLLAGAQRYFATGGLRVGNYNSYFANGSWDMQFNERMSAGVGASVQYQDYDNGRSSSVFNAFVTAHRRFSDQIDATASAGLILTNQKQPGGSSVTSISPSFSFNLCKLNTRERLCARTSREARTSFGLGTGVGASSIGVSTSLGIDYSRQIDAYQSFQLAASAMRYSTNGSGIGQFRSTYLNFLAGYDRKLRPRLAAGVNAGLRKLLVDGRDPKTDLNANAYVRYRLGDVQ